MSAHHSEMSYNQAISVANGIKMELSTIEQQQIALRRIGELLEKAREAEKLLHDHDKDIADRKASLHALDEAYQRADAQARTNHESLVKTLNGEAEVATRKKSEIELAMKAADELFNRHQQDHDKRRAAMDKEIDERQKELQRLVMEFEAFKKSHNL